MPVVETGTIQNGAIALDRPVSLQDGQKVIVCIEVAPPLPLTSTPPPAEEFLRHEFFGQWADRCDLGSSEEYVRKEREKWSPRLTPGD